MANIARPSPKVINSRDLKFAITVIVLDVTFLLLDCPTNLLYLISYFFSFEFSLPYVFTEGLYLLNFSLTFYVNFFVNSIFRLECVQMFKEVLHISQ